VRECDLIMKGGVTSGVAYPGAVAGLARSYRLRDIGGTSAGAIAAVLAAAAEYRRQRVHEDGETGTAGGADPDAGFIELEGTAAELGEDLGSLFQPVPALRPLYRTLLAVGQAPPGRRIAAFAKGALGAFALPLALAALPGALVVWAGYAGPNEGWQILLGLLLLVVVPVVALVAHVGWLVLKVLPRHDFGLCTGLTMAEGRAEGRPAFTDWMHARIESVAGPRDPGRAEGAPLTIGDLAPYDIRVASVTTDLSSRRPWQLPLRAGVHLFSRAEFAELFPPDVVAWLVAEGGAVDAASGDAASSDTVSGRDANDALPGDLYRLPDGPRLPLVVLARLSLSFPGLVSAVPLYRADPDMRDESDAPPRLRRCLFSDGGISSNFPVHFFDGFLPSRPTFGIGFAAFDRSRHGDPADDAARVHLPGAQPSSGFGGVHPVNGLFGFLGAIVNTAKDWQDTLQSRLPGYAERIVEIRLKPGSEGGLHVEMDEATVEELARLGRLAATRFKEDFDWNSHRWLRALALLPTLEERLARVAEIWKASGEGDESDYEAVLTRLPHEVFPVDDDVREDPLATFARALVALGTDAVARRDDDERLSLSQGRRPTCDADLRLVASPDASAPTDCPPPSTPT